MQYKIVTDKQEYIITEENNTVLIENSSLKDFLLDLDENYFNIAKERIKNINKENKEGE